MEKTLTVQAGFSYEYKTNSEMLVISLTTQKLMVSTFTGWICIGEISRRLNLIPGLEIFSNSFYEYHGSKHIICRVKP